MRILGIDPGLTGGAAVLATGGDLDGPARVVDAIDIPTKGEDAKRRVDVLELARWISACIPDVAFIERAQAMPRQGSSSGFIYGRAVGALEAAAILAHVQLHVIEPSAWKKAFALPGTGEIGVTAAKEAARQALIRVMPSAERFVLRKGDHGRAEAVLIAMYGADLLQAQRVAFNPQAA
jgi:Holliday junction resolvasome RuvABC endonuclease subunit